MVFQIFYLNVPKNPIINPHLLFVNSSLALLRSNDSENNVSTFDMRDDEKLVTKSFTSANRGQIKRVFKL